MAIYNRDLKFIYLFEPHTASRAVLQHLPKYVRGCAKIDHHHIGIQEMAHWRNAKLRPKDALQSRIICTVRNPFDTLITRYRVSGFKHVEFQRFLDNQMENPIIINPGMGLYQEAEYHCYYEDLEEDLRWMFNRPELTLGWDDKHKTAGKEPWWTYYTDKGSVDKLCHTWRAYFTRFGYQIDFRDGRPYLEIDPDIRKQRCPKLL